VAPPAPALYLSSEELVFHSLHSSVVRPVHVVAQFTLLLAADVVCFQKTNVNASTFDTSSILGHPLLEEFPVLFAGCNLVVLTFEYRPVICVSASQAFKTFPL
jgi:hypothetical protein